MKYKINEIFKSYQGEGIQIGRKCTFIRFSGCNLKCSWCDTNHQNGNLMTVEQIINKIRSYKIYSIIITGGEPTIWNLEPLLKELKKYWIGLETNGIKDILPIRKYFNWVTVSPKGYIPKWSSWINEVRVPVNKHIDWSYLSELRTELDASYYLLSPINGKENLFRTIKLLGEMNKDFPTWGLSLQTHKIINIK